MPASPELTVDQQRVITVLERMLAMARNDEDDAAMFADVLQPALEELMSSDAFGTEAQCDPRGDGRNGTWSMSHVEGIDG